MITVLVGYYNSKIEKSEYWEGWSGNLKWWSCLYIAPATGI